MTTPTLEPTVDVRRAADRYRTRIGGWTPTTRSPSARTTTPRNTHHGLLLVNNDDIVAPGTGFDTHPHRDMEIVTWVLQGSLVHQDSTGHTGVIYPGLAQRMSAGTGILHSEKNDSWRLPGRPARRSRALRPDVGGARRGGHRARLRAAARSTTTCSPGPGAGRVGHGRARRRARSGSRTATPPCTPRAWSRATRGAARGAVPPPVRRPRHGDAGGRGRADEGDAVRFTATGGQRVTATEPAEILVWEMHATVAA